MGQYQKQPVESIEKEACVEYFHENTDGQTVRRVAKVECQIAGFRDRWNEIIFGRVGYTGSMRFSSPSEAHDFVGVNDFRLLLGGDRSIPMSVIGPDPDICWHFRVGNSALRGTA
jgi:hypothetical protein